MDFLRSFIPFKLEHPAEAAPGTPIDDLRWLTVTGIGFLLVAWLVWKFILPMIGGILRERREQIVATAEQVEETTRETAAMRDDFRQRLDRIEDAAEQRMSEAVREAESLRDHILAEARQNVAALVQRGHDEVGRERAKAMLRLRTQFVEDTVGAAGYAAAKSLDGDQQRRLIEDFVRNVGTPS